MYIPCRSCMKLVHNLITKERHNRKRLDIKITAAGLEALQEATETAIITMMEMSNYCTIHAKRVTLMYKDIKLIYSFTDIHQPGLNFTSLSTQLFN